MSDWKPGDVVEGFVLSRRRKHLLLRVDASIHDDGHWPWLLLDADTEVPLADRGIGEDNVREAHLVVSPARPLVVIDPEDVEQAERLYKAMVAAMAWGVIPASVSDTHAYRREQMRAALRQFANPTPRIEEPTGLGAVVEDDCGKRWIRDGRKGNVDNWFRADFPGGSSWAGLNAVRVLSEGVPL